MFCFFGHKLAIDKTICDFLPTVPGGGTVGLQTDFFSFSSSSFQPPTFFPLIGTENSVGGGVMVL